MAKFNPTLMTEKAPITMTKKEFHAMKAVEYKKIFDLFRAKSEISLSDLLALHGAAGMWQAHASFAADDAETAEKHRKNCLGVHLMNANMNARPYA